MTFIVKKKLSLDFLGEGWESAYAVFSPFTYEENLNLLKFNKKLRKIENAEASDKDLENAAEELKKILTDKLIEGMGYNGKELEAITQDNFKDLPMSVFTYCLTQLKGEDLSPKS